MRVTVLEAISAGLCDEDSSLLREGGAMWRAILEDFSRVPGVRVTTCLDERLRDEISIPSGVECFPVNEFVEWAIWWSESVDESDAVLVIAPETGGLLEHLVAAAPKSLNCSPKAIARCGDKLKLAQHCERKGIRTVPTIAVDWSLRPGAEEFLDVIKPIDGAGCQLTFVVNNVNWKRVRLEYRNSGFRAIRQPLIEGRHLSVAALFSPQASPLLFPIAEQVIRLAPGGQMIYDGGRIPAAISARAAEAIAHLVRRVHEVIQGLRGYVGFDIILPHDAPDQPLLVEINPRLTTSYIGYRRLCEQNLAAAMLGIMNEPLTWRNQVIAFDGSGAEISSRSTAG